MKLSDLIQERSRKARIVEDCTKLIDQQVAAKGGISGFALKAAYGVVKGIDASYIAGAISRLLPEMLHALDPLWMEGIQAGNPVDHLVQQRSRAADAVLAVTDARAKNANGIVRSSYGKLRQSVKGDVEDAIPGLAEILGKHL